MPRFVLNTNEIKCGANGVFSLKSTLNGLRNPFKFCRLAYIWLNKDIRQDKKVSWDLYQNICFKHYQPEKPKLMTEKLSGYRLAYVL